MKTRIHSAFTLIELLTVIAIIGVLAGILLPVTSRVRESARNAQCISNLRQIGTALNLYVNEYNGRYPGPLYAVQGPYHTATSNTLARYIAPYLPEKNVASTKTMSMVFLCPTWDLVMKGRNAEYPYIINTNPSFADGTNWGIQPFGDANRTDNPAKNISAISDRPLSQTWLLTELDKERNPTRTELMPDKAVHGNHRNQLYYDYHVARAAVK